MLVTVTKSYSKTGMWDSETIWARVAEKDLLSLYTILEHREKPIKTEEYVKVSLQKILQISEDPIGKDSGITHFMIFEKKPNVHIVSLDRLLEKLGEGSFSFAKFSSIARRKHWFRIMKDIIGDKKSDDFIRTVRGITYAIIAPEHTFNILRSELRRFGILNPTSAIEEFIKYIKELPPQSITRRDVELAIGKKLIKMTQPLTVLTDSDGDELQVIPAAMQSSRGILEILDYKEQPHSVLESETKASWKDSEAGTEVQNVHFREMPGEHVTSQSRPRPDDTYSTVTSLNPIERPAIDEDVDWKRFKKITKSDERTLYIDIIPHVDLEDKKSIIRFVRNFISMANRALKDNHRGILLMAVNDMSEVSTILNEEPYHAAVDEFIQPKPMYNLRTRRFRKDALCAILIQPVGSQPFEVSKSLKLEEGSEEMDLHESWMRHGTSNRLLDRSEFIKLVKDIAFRYGI